MDNKKFTSDIKLPEMIIDNGEIRQENMMTSKDVFADTWICTDDVGRNIGNEGVVPNENKVGMFYFLWHDTRNELPVFDHSKAYYEGGIDEVKRVMQEGPLGYAHYWAEPYFGYYCSEDEWVVRKHGYQLAAAGVDFIFFDVTNGFTYTSGSKKIMSIWSQMRKEGYMTPQIMFNCGIHPDASKASFYDIWNNIYSKGIYKELWFMWEGKPVILIPDSLVEELTDEMKEFFTFRKSWAYTKDIAGEWYTETDGKGCWPWADMYPQLPGKSPDGKDEQMIVMCGFWVNGSYGTNAGRSFSGGVQPPNDDKDDLGFSLTYKTSGKGLAFEEQFGRAIEVNPEIVMITGWNEWWAGRWEGFPAIGQTIANSYTVTADDPFTKNYFVDNLNPEYSRDLEPVKGLFNDNYYYQLAKNVRRYKGARAPQSAFGQKTINIDEGIEQWYSVGPEFRDYRGDTVHRDEMSYLGGHHYVNETGRNDFVTMKVSSDDKYFYFLAECAENITSPEGTNWMNLFIDSDNDPKTGWYGYDYIINRTQKDGKCSVQKFVNNEWKFEDVGYGDYRVNGKYIQIKLDKELVDSKTNFNFKWADNSCDDGDIMKFLDLGDTAPNDRFNYKFTTEKTEQLLPDVLTDSMIVLKAGSYNAFVGKQSVILDESNTNAIALGDYEQLYVPKSFAEKYIKLDVSKQPVLNHYGTEYVEISDAVKSSGRIISYKEGIAVIDDKEYDNNTLLTLYRTLQ